MRSDPTPTALHGVALSLVLSETAARWKQGLCSDQDFAAAISEAMSLATAPGTPGSILLDTTVADWRIADGDTDDLTEAQRVPMTVTVTRAGWSGLLIGATAPEVGEVVNLHLELDQGAPKLNVHVPGDDGQIGAVLHVDTRGIHVALNGPAPNCFLASGPDALPEITDEWQPAPEAGAAPKP